jgi:hypothetical protein
VALENLVRDLPPANAITSPAISPSFWALHQPPTIDQTFSAATKSSHDRDGLPRSASGDAPRLSPGRRRAVRGLASGREQVAGLAEKEQGAEGRTPAVGRKRENRGQGRCAARADDEREPGYTRLQGALKNLGLDLGRSTIQRILKDSGIEPAPLRGRTLPWAAFLRAHWAAIAAADSFSGEVLTQGGLVRYLVLFVIELKTRRVHVAGVTCRADGAWMAQMGRNLTDATIGPLTGFTHLLADRDRSTRRRSRPPCEPRASNSCACARTV